MPRVAIRPELYLALSPNAAATALAIPARKIRDATRAGKLRVFQHGMHRRILIRDLERWVETWPKPKGKSNG